MKQVAMSKLAVAVILGAAVSGTAFAQHAVSNIGWYVGAGLTQVQTTEDAPEPDNFTLSVGYQFANNFGVEYQYSGSYKEDSVDGGTFIEYLPEIDGDVLYDNTEYNASLNTSAIFATYVFGDQFYGKVKAGFMKAEYSVDFDFDYEILDGDFQGEAGSDTVTADESENGWAAGIGAGYKFSANSAIEVEYLTTADKIDINFLSVGYKYSF